MNGRIIRENYVLTQKEKNIKATRNRLDDAIKKLNLPSYIFRETLEVYTGLMHKNICIGRGNNEILCACLYIITVKNNVQRNMAELLNVFDLNKRTFLRCVKLVKVKARINLDYTEHILDLIINTVNILNLKPETLKTAVDIFEKHRLKFSGKNPRTIAAAIIYVSSIKNKDKVSQKKLSNMLEIMENSIRTRSKDLFI